MCDLPNLYKGRVAGRRAARGGVRLISAGCPHSGSCPIGVPEIRGARVAPRETERHSLGDETRVFAELLGVFSIEMCACATTLPVIPPSPLNPVSSPGAGFFAARSINDPSRLTLCHPVPRDGRRVPLIAEVDVHAAGIARGRWFPPRVAANPSPPRPAPPPPA